MNQTIQLKRSAGSIPPTTLAAGEPAWLEGTKTLYVGTLAGGILAIAGDGAGFLKSLPPITISGDVTGSGKESIQVSLANVVQPGTGTKLSYNAKGLVTGAAALAEADLPNLAIGKVTGLQESLNSKATLDANGQIPSNILPPLAISDTFEVASQQEMLALTAQRGDVAIRSDGAGSFILRAEPASTLANWRQLSTPGGGVASVNGQTGSVVNLRSVNIPFDPTGGIAATTAQAAIAELDAEKLGVDQQFTFAGDVTGIGAVTAPISLILKDIVAPATAPKVTFNAKGLVTGSSALAAGDIPVVPISKVDGLQAALDSKVSRSEMAVVDGGTF